MLKIPVYGSMGSALVEKDPKTNVNSGLGLCRSRGPERFPDHVSKEKHVLAARNAAKAAQCSLKQSIFDYTLMGKDSDTSVRAAVERARDVPPPLTTDTLPQRGALARSIA